MRVLDPKSQLIFFFVSESEFSHFGLYRDPIHRKLSLLGAALDTYPNFHLQKDVFIYLSRRGARQKHKTQENEKDRQRAIVNKDLCLREKSSQIRQPELTTMLIIEVNISEEFSQLTWRGEKSARSSLATTQQHIYVKNYDGDKETVRFEIYQFQLVALAPWSDEKRREKGQHR